MKTFTIYVEFYGKKVKTSIQAANRDSAIKGVKEKLKEKFEVVKVVIEKDINEDNSGEAGFDFLKNMFGIK